MTMTRRIFISGPRDKYLDARRNQLKWAIVDEIEKSGYEAQAFGTPEGGKGLPAALGSWSAERAEEVMRRCVGAAILGFPIWTCLPSRGGETGDERTSLVTEYCHYEAALARAFGLPILAVLEEGVEERVTFAPHASEIPIKVPIEADPSWATQNEFQIFLSRWKKIVESRKDVFLAYSSKREVVANGIREILGRAGATVLDWRRDFDEGGTILEQIEKAAQLTTGGIFLFTRDDDLIEGSSKVAAPRDNVVFEAGFFAHAKGSRRILVILEEGARMPADLGGVIYAALSDRSDASGLEEPVTRFIGGRL